MVNHSGHTSVINEMSVPRFIATSTWYCWKLDPGQIFFFPLIALYVLVFLWSLSDGKLALLCCDIDWPVLDRLIIHLDTSLRSPYENSTLPRTSSEISG
jgi:hypothetical protein